MPKHGLLNRNWHLVDMGNYIWSLFHDKCTTSKLEKDELGELLIQVRDLIQLKEFK
jgi:hypothetical protein